MKNRVKYIIVYFLSFFLGAHLSFAQKGIVDSLQVLLKSTIEDSNKVNHLNALAWELMYSKPDSSITLGSRALVLSEKLKWEMGIANSYWQLGNSYDLKADFIQALVFFYKGLKEYEELNNSEGIMRSYRSIGIVYSEQASFTKAIDFYIKALKLAEQLHNVKYCAYIYVSLGNIFHKQKEYERALDYYLRAFEIMNNLKQTKTSISILGNIGTIYRAQKKYEKAFEYMERALTLAQEIGDKYLISDFKMNLGIIYASMLDYVNALKFLNSAKEIKQEIQDNEGIALCLSNIGMCNISIGNFKDAELQLLKAHELDSVSGALNDFMGDKENLAKLYSKTGQYKLSSKFYGEVLLLKDTIFTIEKKRNIARKEMSFEFEKKEAESKIEHEKEIAIRESEKNKQRIIILFVVGGLVLVLAFSGVLYNRFKITKRQNTIIEQQKSIVEKKNKEIFDSLSYAKRLQQAILPPESFIKSFLPNSFVFYLPKDIVAGDFYWVETTKMKDTIFFAVADCTGHGVPGAMVSMVGNNALNRCVKGFNLTTPAKVLDQLCKLVDKTFSKSESEVQDGMDISLCAFNKETSVLEWAGAYNPLLLVKDGVLHEYVADKQPIGKYEYRKSFTNHSIQVKSGDTVYLFSDGFADQFGGSAGKKFQYKKFKQLLLSLNEQPLNNQYEIIKQTFTSWKSDFEQTDDVCVMGVKF